MVNEKEYLEQMIGAILLIFTTYTITKDLVDENILIIFYNSHTISAVLYAGILDILLMISFLWFINHLKRQGKFN